MLCEGNVSVEFSRMAGDLGCEASSNMIVNAGQSLRVSIN